jgi:hypothetical protein
VGVELRAQWYKDVNFISLVAILGWLSPAFTIIQGEMPSR